MGMLDEVIAAALRSRGQARQGQVDQGQRAPDQLSQIAAALAALLSARQSPGAIGQTAAAPAGQQNTANGLDLLINRFKQNGLEGIINSWIGTGSNQTISPPQLRQVLGHRLAHSVLVLLCRLGGDLESGDQRRCGRAHCGNSGRDGGGGWESNPPETV